MLEQQNVLDHNTDKFRKLYSRQFSHRANRCLTYISDTPAKELFKMAFLPTGLGMTLGGTLGGLIGLIGGPKGAAVGAGSGAGVGFCAGTTYASYRTRKEYRKWLRQYRADEILTEFDALFRAHPNLNEFLCPLTGQLMHYPFIDPWGFSYEKEAIMSWIKKNHSSPKTELPLTTDDLRPNYMLMGQLARTYRDLVEQNVLDEPRKLNPIQLEGIGILLNDLREQMGLCFHSENRELLKLLREGKISRKTYTAQLDLMSSYLDP